MTLETNVATTPREVPWQKLTHDFPEGTKFSDALTLAGLDYRVEFRDLFTQDPEYGLRALFSHRATVRTDNGQVLGVVGSRYNIVQNKDALGFLSDIVDSGDIKIVGGGYFRHGARPWIETRLPEDIVLAGDRTETIRPYIFGATGHDGGLQVTVALTPVRVVCANTYAMALKSPRRFAIRHLASVDGRISEARRTLGISFAYFKEYAQAMEQLLQKPMIEGSFREIVNALLPQAPDSASDEQKENVQKNRAALLGIYLNSPTVASVRDTQYGALQAITEWYDHVKNGQRKKGTREAEERKTWDIVLGDGVLFKDKALALITAKRP
jgi:phage/plasmid-like protein (TIGR03299 family)